MKAKWLPISAAVFMALSSASAFAADANGWEFHGYGRLGGQWDGDGASKMSTMGKQDYRTVTSMDENANQVEIQAKKRTQVKGKVYGDFVTRAEYGNQNAGKNGYFVSSEGSLQTQRSDAQFELKEAYIEMGGFDFLGSDTKIWAGQRFLNRQQGLLSKEFWKQSSGVGAGVQVGQAGFAVVSADAAGQVRGSHDFSGFEHQWAGADATNTTATSFDLYYYGVTGLGGSFDFDAKFMHAANIDSTAAACKVNGNEVQCADEGFGASITYNRNYYGMKGWSQTAIAYGTGMASNRGVNFGSWNGSRTGGYGNDSAALFLTSYGVAELTKDLQLGTEVTYWAPTHVGWAANEGRDLDVERFIIAAQPSYKINDNLRAIFTGSYSFETNEDQNGQAASWFGNNWAGTVHGVNFGNYDLDDTKAQYYAVEAALAFTVDSDYFGRPQIKPFVSWVGTNSEYFAPNIGVYNGDKGQTVFGVEAEVWF